MKTALILHGKPNKESYFKEERDAQSNSHWLPWIQHQLLLKGVLAQTPEFPEPYEPSYGKWKTVFEQFPINENTMLIGHSCGAGFLVRWLSEHKVRVGNVALVAPWLDPDQELSTGFFDFEIDAAVPERTQQLSVFVSDDDDEDIQQSVRTLTSMWPQGKLVSLSGKGHFTIGDMGTREFPELLETLLN